MARDIEITSNYQSIGGSASNLPRIDFKGKNAETISLYVDDDGTLRYEGSTTDLLTITDDTTGLLFSVNDISGLSLVEVYDTGKIVMGVPLQNTFVISASGSVGIGGTASPINTLTVDGNLGVYSGTSSLLYVGNNVGIGTASPSETLDVAGTAAIRNVGSEAGPQALNITADGVLTLTTSDISMKENIRSIDNSLELVNQLNGVYFDWKENGIGDIGLIAQEVNNVIPELAFTNTNTGLMGVHYDKTVALLINAVKELSDEVKKLKGE